MVLAATGGLVLAREYFIGRQVSELQQEAAAGPHVLVVGITHSPASREIKLPTSVRGFDETDIYAKVSGYVKTISVDKGDRITKGQVLVTIESPETDQAVANARASYNLAVITERRFKLLLDQAVVATQDYDNRHAATVEARAALDQQIAMQSYETIRAPFDGIVTARYIDPGHLAPGATSGSAASSAMLSVARLRPLRVMTYVPQSVALYIRNGDQAEISTPEYPGRKFMGTIARHPDALASDTRTMIVEVDLPNDDLALFPGMYGAAKFTVSGISGAALVPDDALVFRDGKVFVPAVRDRKIRLIQVELGTDNGVMVEVTGELAPDEKVALNVGQAAREGENVQPVEKGTAH